MRTNEFLQAICREIQEKLFRDLKACEVHDGRFDLGELKRISTRTPAVYVACLGTPRMEDPGTEQTDAVKQLAIYVVTKNAPGLSRGEAARNLVEALETYLPRARWGLRGIGAAENVRSENLYGGAIDRQGIALWAVSWRQALRLGESVFDEEACPLPSELYVSQEPETGLEHEADYERVTG